MSESVLVKQVGMFGIFEEFFGFFNVANLQNGRIADTVNFFSVEDAEEYISQGVKYSKSWEDSLKAV